MTGVAFLYPGQGAQRVGMGAALGRTDGAALERYLELAEDVSSLPIRRLCLEGPIAELTRTEVSQPALLAVSLALTEVARDVGFEPAFVAGHSLGEYAAAIAAGVLDAEDGMRLVAARGRLMAARQLECPGAMAAVIGLGETATAVLCREVGTEAEPLAVANVNTGEQIVVSGVTAAVERLAEVARHQGARVVRLPVGGAFHSPIMDPVREAMAGVADAFAWHDPNVALVANVSGAPLVDGAAVRAALVEQISRPVRWADCVRTLVAAGCDLFVELGAGVLTGLVRSVDPGVPAHAADSRARLTAVAEGVPRTGRPAREDRLLEDLGGMLRRVDPVPPHVLAAARAAQPAASTRGGHLRLVPRGRR
jgi:[acyl-carrier-protein] S-malonyltransferase